MKRAISNIAWTKENDEVVYPFLQKRGFTGLEIAPTRLFPEKPYDHLPQAKVYAQRIREEYGLHIPSMQSIWYGVSESIWGSDADRSKLIDYTKKAVDFAKVIGCENLVFGCPKNRIIPARVDLSIAEHFFATIAEYAHAQRTFIALEPNPPYYNTNFINTTAEAFAFCRRLSVPGLAVNVDLGTCIHYNEGVGFLSQNADLIHHLHISEPLLAPIMKRELHKELQQLPYAGYFSIEMANKNDLALVKQAVDYIAGVLP